MKKRLIPFKWLPGSWGLQGQTYEKAKAEYELEGYELETKLNEIEFSNDPTNFQKSLNQLKIDLKYNKISQNIYDENVINLDPRISGEEKTKLLHDVSYKHQNISEYDYQAGLIKFSNKTEDEKKLDLLELDFKNHKVTKTDYEKQKATISKQPWVSVVNFGVDKKNPSNLGELELDWNQYFIDELKAAGYVGPSDHYIIEKWFNMICSTVAIEAGLVESLSTTSGDTGLPPIDDAGRREYK